MKELISKREQAELRKAAIEYVRCWKLPVSAEAGVALKNLHTAARAFAEKTDAEWAAEVAELRGVLVEARNALVVAATEPPHAETCSDAPCTCWKRGFVEALALVNPMLEDE